MDKAWVKQKTKEKEKRIAEIHNEIREALKASDLLEEDDINKFISTITESTRMGFTQSIFMFPDEVRQKYKEFYFSNHEKEAAALNFSAFYYKVDNALKTINLKELCELERTSYKYYQDSEPVEFDGDIIITDPCYVIKDRDRSTAPKWNDYMSKNDYSSMTTEELKQCGYFEDYKKLKEAEEKWDAENPDDWEVCDYGSNMEALGINHFMTRNTIYGDWSCSTYNTDTKRKIGSFCADAGLVSVILLEDVLKYNPSYDDHLKKKWTTTWIKNFKGTVKFVIKEVKWTLDEDTSYGKKGDEFTDYEVEVEGHGLNKKTGKPINFVGKQTGF